MGEEDEDFEDDEDDDEDDDEEDEKPRGNSSQWSREINGFS